jgi:hypothetical protein
MARVADYVQSLSLLAQQLNELVDLLTDAREIGLAGACVVRDA